MASTPPLRQLPSDGLVVLLWGDGEGSMRKTTLLLKRSTLHFSLSFFLSVVMDVRPLSDAGIDLECHARQETSQTLETFIHN